MSRIKAKVEETRAPIDMAIALIDELMEVRMSKVGRDTLKMLADTVVRVKMDMREGRYNA